MASRPSVKEYKVVLADTSEQNLINIMRFKHPHKCDLEKLTDPLLYRQEPPEKVETEEEAKRREEWRKKKKYKARKQNADDKPWVLKEKKKDGVTFYGRKEGGINTSASYYILRLAQNGDFEAAPVNNWYDFVPPIKYNYLNYEEAEERFEKRNKTMNYFSIMVSKRIKENDGEEEEKGKGKAGTSKGLIRSDDSDDDDGFSSPDSDTEVKRRSSTSKGGAKGQKKKKKKERLDIEAEEESDEGDFESKEVDYSSSSSNNDDDEKIKAIREEPRDDAEVERKEEKGIDKVFDESSTDEEEDELTESGKALKALIKKQQGDEDNEEDEIDDVEESPDNSKMETSEITEDSQDAKTNIKQEDNSNVSATSSSPPAKKPKLESPGRISPEEVMKYLKRKPLTSKALVKKFVKLKTELNKGQVVNMLGEVLKSMPQIEKQKIKGKMYLSIHTDSVT